ncbi:MAG: hypothetical protein ACMG6S_02080 [Byssovorax sp.]
MEAMLAPVGEPRIRALHLDARLVLTKKCFRRKASTLGRKSANKRLLT